jgi:hypothetical protein
VLAFGGGAGLDVLAFGGGAGLDVLAFGGGAGLDVLAFGAGLLKLAHKLSGMLSLYIPDMKSYAFFIFVNTSVHFCLLSGGHLSG